MGAALPLSEMMEQLMIASSTADASALVGDVVANLADKDAKAIQEFGFFSKLTAACGESASPQSKEAALLLIKALLKHDPASTGSKGFLFHVSTDGGKSMPAMEPHLVGLLPAILLRTGDKSAPVRAAAEVAAADIVKSVCPHAVRLLLPILFEGVRNRKSWRTQEVSLRLIGLLPAVGPRQVASDLHIIVPLLSEYMAEGKDQVCKAAQAALLKCGETAGNRDIEPAMKQILDAIARPSHVADCVNRLSGITFVQPVRSPALSLIVPVLARGMKERTALSKRKAVVVVENVLRLVEEPLETAPFLPMLLPGVERVSVEVADPECRQTAGRVLKTLRGMQAEVEAAEVEAKSGGGAAVQGADVLEKMLQGVITSGAREEVAAGAGGLMSDALRYAASMCSGLVAGKEFEPSDWSRCVAPYLAPHLQPWGEDSEATAAALLKAVQDSRRAMRGGGGGEGEEEDEGEDLCDCEFSLGYGGKILLSATRLWLKRGRRYGLCGHNGCGKSTLMRSIASGKLDGFPSQDELRTVYVEHDLDSTVVDRSPVEYLLTEEELSGKVDEAAVVTALETTGFDEEKRSSPISSLSGGWKMKLALARAMLIGADILLLDEPTNHLDVHNIKWLEDYLTSLKTLSCLIVSHDSGFLDNVCTDIIHYEKRKLKHYRGNLAAFVKVKPEAMVYYDLNATTLKYKLPVPGALDGIRRKESPIMKLNNVSYSYPGSPVPQLSDVNVQCTLGTRVAVVGVNGAGKSTLIKLMTGETRASTGTVWKHPNLGMAYVAQHAFHHVEQHLEKSPNEYIRWRFARGEDREELHKVNRKIGKEEMRAMEELIMHNGVKKQLEQLLARRKSKRSYEYEVKWVGLKPVFNSWLSRELLEDLGFEKLVHEVDAKEVARLGVYGRPLTIPGVQEHLDNFGLEAEFGTYGQIGNLSGGQKVKVVLAAAMWSNPHMIVLDEPTNFLDRDSLAALVGAIKDFEGGVVVISHNKEFLAELTNETWTVANRTVSAPGNPAYEKALKAGTKKK